MEAVKRSVVAKGEGGQRERSQSAEEFWGSGTTLHDAEMVGGYQFVRIHRMHDTDSEH